MGSGLLFYNVNTKQKQGIGKNQKHIKKLTLPAKMTKKENFRAREEKAKNLTRL